jgi:rubrerythrin
MTTAETNPEWRCTRCAAVLGVREGQSLRLRVRKGEYLFKGKVVAVCPSCKALNELNVLPSCRPDRD